VPIAPKISVKAGQNGDSEFAEAANHATTSVIGNQACHRKEATGLSLVTFMSVITPVRRTPSHYPTLHPADPDVDEVAEHSSRQDVCESDGRVPIDLSAANPLADTRGVGEDLCGDRHENGNRSGQA
jgi:hypothetical protein